MYINVSQATPRDLNYRSNLVYEDVESPRFGVGPMGHSTEMCAF